MFFITSPKNLLSELITVYFKPKDKCIYTHSVDELKLMGHIKSKDTGKYSVKLDDEFVCTDKENIIQLIKIDKEENIIDINI